MLTLPSLALTFTLLFAGCNAFQCSTSPFNYQTKEYFVCPNEDYKNYNDPEITNECDYKSTLPVNLCDSELQTTLVLCWRIMDSASGAMQVIFPLLPQKCNFTGYDLTLMVHEATTCPTNTDDFYKHSKRDVNVHNCLEPSCRSQCKQRGEVQFRHVFSSCYQLYMSPKRHLQAYQELVSGPVFITTQYVKTPISIMHSPIFHLEWNVASTMSMQANFPFIPSSSHISVSHGIDTALGDNACRNTGVTLASCVTCLGSPEIQCTSRSGETVAPVCSYQGDSVVKCKFSDLKPGNYCVRIQFDDDRCAADSVWSEYNNYSSCTWEVFKEFLSAEQRAVEVIGDLHTSQTISPVVLIVAFVIIVFVVVLLVLYRHLVSGTPDFRPIPKKMSQVAERPEVLLLYARDCPLFMEAVVHLRTLMRRVYNCKVIDYWEDCNFLQVGEQPARWLWSHMHSSRGRVVLITSPASVVQEAAVVRSTPVHYREPKAYDYLLTAALTTLHETSSHDSYSRLFVVRLDSGLEGTFPLVRTYLNPLTTYILPTHLNKLMATLYNLDSTVCTIATDSQTDFFTLSTLIAEYREYLKENPQYIDNIMFSEGLQSVLQILT